MTTMDYSQVVQFFKSKFMKQDELIDTLTHELYSNNYTIMEHIIEEYVLNLNEEEIDSLNKFISNYLVDWVMIDIATCSKLDLEIADSLGEVVYTKLPPVKPKSSDLWMSQTKGPRTNTNRRGQAYNAHATHAQNSVIEGGPGSYYKTTGW